MVEIMVNFIGGLFFGMILGLVLGWAFFHENFIEIKTLDDKKTAELMKLLDLAEGDRNDN